MKCSVCKTVVSHPNKAQFMLVTDDGDPVLFEKLEELVLELHALSPSSKGLRFLKNEIPGDIIWNKRPNKVLECERLSRDEVRELARLLRQ